LHSAIRAQDALYVGQSPDVVLSRKCLEKQIKFYINDLANIKNVQLKERMTRIVKIGEKLEEKKNFSDEKNKKKLEM
jgi:hypothetical protein